MCAKDHVFCLQSEKKNSLKEGETRFCQIGPCLPPHLYVFAFAYQYIVSPRGQTANRTVTQMRHPLLVLKDDQIVRDNRLPVHCRHLVSRRHRTVIP